MLDDIRVNLLLLIINIIALGNFAYPPENYSLIIFVFLAIIPIDLSIKSKMIIVSLLGLTASFFPILYISEILSISALGLAVNTAYQIDLSQGPAAINTALGLSQFLSYWSKEYLSKYSINRDITVLIFILPNLFLSYNCEKIKSKKLYIINPFIDDQWQYSLGFTLGIYTANMVSIQKHWKFFIISVILLVQYNFSQYQIMIGILCFIRGLLVYTQKIYENQVFFLIGFVGIKLLLKEYLLFYMFIGYLVIGITIYQKYQFKRQMRQIKKDEAIGTQPIEMIDINKEDKIN